MGTSVVADAEEHIVARGPKQLPDAVQSHREICQCQRSDKSILVAECRSAIQMKIAMVYIYADSGDSKFDAYTMRFLDSYHSNPPGLDHESVVVINGARRTSEIDCLFSSLPNYSPLEHDNSGYDIGGFQFAARTIPCDLMVFFGASTYLSRPGWLIRMVNAFNRHGNAQYGAMGNRGNLAVGVWPHIRTTAFWMHPKLMNSYPDRVTLPNQRHPFEHGKNCFTEWVTKLGLKSWVITWANELLWEKWDSDREGYSQGKQLNLLAGDRMSEPPYFPTHR